MIMWGTWALICALLASALLLRRMPLMALALTLAGLAAASMAPKTLMSASGLQVVVACAAGLEICYMAATRTRKVSVPGVAPGRRGLADSGPGTAVSEPRCGRTASPGCLYPLSRSPCPWS
jgi:hypothetical protein